MLDILVHYGSDVAAKDIKGFTPLHEIITAISHEHELILIFRYLEYTSRHFWEKDQDDQAVSRALLSSRLTS